MLSTWKQLFLTCAKSPHSKRKWRTVNGASQPTHCGCSSPCSKSFYHPSLYLDYNWSVCEDHHNSDHFPIIIEQNTFSTEDHNPKWKLNRANWDLFNTLCTGKLVPENFKESSDPIADFTSSLIEISKECIPQTLTNPTKVIHGTMTTVKKQLNSLSKLYLNSKDLQIPTISMTSKYLELKPVEQLKFRSVSHGDLMFRKSIIKHL